MTGDDNHKKNPNKVFPTYVKRMKNKVAQIEAYMEEHTLVLTSRKSHQLDVMVDDLRAQFQRMEKAWDDMREEVDAEPVYDEAEGKVLAAESSMIEAIRKRKKRQP